MTDRYAVIGNPIGHTKSPLIHATFAQQTGQDIDYVAIEGRLDGFAAAVADFRARGGRGMNVTLPFKLQAFELATDATDRARLAGAVNALKFEGDRIFADNLDGEALVTDIQANLGFAMKAKRVLLLGAGGAARGGMQPFLDQQPAELMVVNRTVSKALALGEQYGVPACGYPDVPARRFDIVVNATSASLRGELPPIRSEVFSPGGLAYDLVYGKGLTPFLDLARATGVRRLADGIGMLVEQAGAAFAWWRGVRPDTRAVIDLLSDGSRLG